MVKMDIQTQLKAILKNKYQNLNDLTLPINLNYQSRKKLFHNFEAHYNRHIDDSNLDPIVISSNKKHPFPLEDLLKCPCEHSKSQKTILTFGACGIGKTTAVQKCALDWAEDRAHTHIDLLFPIPCWELTLLEIEELSLIQLLNLIFPDLKELSAKSLSGQRVWFVFDELEEYCFFDFSSPKVLDVNQVTSPYTLMHNLIKGNLLPSAHIWVTTRYAAIDLPEHHVLKETEMLGFNNEQKEQHILKLVGDDDLANRVIDHIKISRSLHCLCRIPYMCTVMATVLKKHVKKYYKIHPMTLTQIYSSLIDKSLSDFFAKLLPLFEKHCTGLYCFWINEERLHDNNVQVTIAQLSTFAQEHPLLLKEEKSVHGVSMFCFAHVSVLEYLIALAKLNKVTRNNPPYKYSTCFQEIVEFEAHDCHGDYDICLRFLFGLLKEHGTLQISDPFFAHIKEEMQHNYFDYTSVLLIHCLREFDSHFLLNDVKMFYKTGVPPLQVPTSFWVEVMVMIMNIEGMQEKFEIKLPVRCDQKVLRSLPEILKSKKAMLRFSNLSDTCCPALASVLGVRESHLRELDLGFNSITDRGVESLVQGLSDQDCRLKSLRLQGCELTSSACEHLATVLKQRPNLKELDLSCNSIGDVGLKHLANGLESPMCQLETLRISQCNIKREGGFHLASALEKNPSYLKWLDLSINRIGNKAANELFTKFDISRLRKLEMCFCGLTERCCATISDALKLEKSCLVELNLSSNNLKDAGAHLISAGLFAWSRLEKLNISRCGISKLGCFYLSKVLSCISAFYNKNMRMEIGWQATELREMDLSRNKLTDEGAVYISTGLCNPYSHLRRLNLIECSLTSDCCADLASHLSSSKCTVAELDLSSNSIQDRGVKKLCVALKSPECALQMLFLRNCGLTSKCVPFFNMALKTNLHLTELFLMGNQLDDVAKKVLLGMIRNNAYKLQTVDLPIE